MKTYLAQGCATYSKRKSNYAANVPDTLDEKTIDRWNDWSCGLGANLKGWQNSFSLTHSLAEPVAKLFCKRFHCDKVKILQSGSAACDAAVRIARAWNGKPFVYWAGYHGCGNDFISCEKPGLGTAESPSVKFASVKDLLRVLSCPIKYSSVSCVFIEPVQLEYSPERIKELELLRELTRKLKIVLIFDEVITGMRFLKGSVANATGIQPDLIVAGKGIGNGYPISFVGGSEEMMEKDYFISNTHNANEIALKESKGVLEEITNGQIEKLWKRGEKLLENITDILPDHIRLVGYPTRAEWQTFDMNMMGALWELMASRNHIIGRAWFLNFNHTDLMINTFLSDLEWAVKKLGNGYKAKGRTPTFSFKRN